LSVTVVAALVARASGDVINVVSPSSAENVEGDQPAPPPDSQARRLQFLFPASDFLGLPNSHRLIVSWNFRADQTQTEPANWSFPDSQIWMSTTTRDALSEVYDNNHGPDKTLVHAGPLSFPLLGTGPPQGPRDFAAGMRLQAPFFYDPSQGSLLVEWANFGNSTPVPGPIRDLQTTSTETVLASEPGQVNSATGTLLSRLPVSQFAFDIPGDYNKDGVVDAADYVVWRDGLGSIYTQSDYDEWRANFGQIDGRGLSMSRAVPEPDAWKLLALVAISCGLRRRKSEHLPSKT
jgi:hypothetical protein